MKNPTKEELIQLVARIQNAEGTEEEINSMIEQLQINVSYPEVSDLIFYPEKEMTAEQIIEVALAYAPPKLEVTVHGSRQQNGETDLDTEEPFGTRHRLSCLHQHPPIR